ncbi:MAG: DNA cytosine methyltransferase [Bacilli bacterium]
MDHKKDISHPLKLLRLQSFPDDYKFDENEKQVFKQLGNAVNVKVIESMFRMFVKFIDEKRGVSNE